MSDIDWGTKRPNEAEHKGIDWADALAEGDSIVTVVWSYDTMAGVSRSAETVAGTVTKALFSDGIDGQAMRINCTITTAGGETLTEFAKLKIKA